jgi:nitrate/nitrite transport system permease protein
VSETTSTISAPDRLPAAPARAAGQVLATLVGAARPAALAVAGFAGFYGLWWAIAVVAAELPTPNEGLRALGTLLSSPFHDNGPNDKGIGLQLWASLKIVFIGFALASVAGVFLGFVMGASRAVWSAMNPVAQLLRPVSPLAWFPLGLVVAKSAPTASMFVIFITALWPTLINTAFGVASVPQDHKNVARVFRFSRVKTIRHVIAPYSLPSVLTGMRISMGIAWMVIVAVEMMSGSSGIGFFVWDAYNAGNLSQVTAAILLIGAVGVALDLVFGRLLKLTTYEERD